jgi:PAS domain S-box-containing protein
LKFISGSPQRIVISREDITQRKLRDEQVSKLSKAMEHIPVILIITDINGNIEYVNSKFIQMTGYCYDEIIGKNTRILRSGTVKPEEYRKLWNTISSGKEWRGELLNKKKNNEFYWASVLISPLFNERDEITHFISIQEDITHRKNYEEQLIIAKEEAEKSNNLKSAFLAQMSHEIRTPLNNILTYSRILEDELSEILPIGLGGTFKVINSSSKRLIRTIELILNISKIQSGNFDAAFNEINLDKDILADIIMEFYFTAKEKGIKLIYQNKSKSPRIFADQYTTSQIFMNLIDNAIKFTNEGEVVVKLYNSSKDEICVEVTDTGIGISDKFLPELYLPFRQEDYSTTRGYEGTGLGLTLVKNYVELNSGRISVTTQKYSGTTFRIVFPALLKSY